MRGPRETWVSEVEEGIRSVLWRLHGTFVHMMGQRNQLGEVKRQSRDMVLRCHRWHEAAWMDCARGARTRDGEVSVEHLAEDFWLASLGGPGEPLYALWDPQGRPRRPPDGPDGLGDAHAESPAGERG